MSLSGLLRRPDAVFRRSLAVFVCAYFLVLFAYPLARASSTTFFFGAYGAKASPVAIFWSVFVLVLAISCCNWLQKHLSVQRVFLIVSTVSGILFGVSTLGVLNAWGPVAYVSFIWKEVYIVLQVHLLLAYGNNYFSKEDFKLLLGPVGAAGSIGAILGGFVTSGFSAAGTGAILGTAAVLSLAPAIFFAFTVPVRSETAGEPGTSPLAALKGDSRASEYVATVATIVALTQFVINIADFRFHVEFEGAVSGATERTAYLGRIYSFTNLLTLVFQVLLLPVILPRVSLRKYHLFIPATYFLCVGGLMLGSQVGLLPVAALYTYFKAADYSLFSAGKELLYQPLSRLQKYGAKYLTDMLVYRAAKAMVAAVLIYVQSSTMLNMLMLIFLVLWTGLVLRLFQLHRRLFS